MSKKAVYAGSFDLLTNGHLWMIQEGAKIFGQLVVSIGHNPGKDYQFTLEERKSMLEEVVRDIPNVSVKVFVGDFLINHAKEIGADTLLRGIRNETDYESERGMRYVNAGIDDSISTIFLIPPRDLVEVSSSLVKGLIGPLGWRKVIKPYLPPSVYSAVILKYLRKTFDAPWKSAGIKVNDDIFKEVVSRYSEPHRHYHTLTHIADCLDELNHFSHSPEAEKLLTPFNKIVLTLAIWFHDFIYDAPASDNEEQSAERFKDLVNGLYKNVQAEGIPIGLDDVIAHTTKLIRATKTHEGTHPLTKLMLDIDLSILGQDPDTFKTYDDNIRKEYSWVLEPVCTMNRKRIMRGFYEKERLFQTDFFHTKYEKQAKENLKGIL